MPQQTESKSGGPTTWRKSKAKSRGEPAKPCAIVARPIPVCVSVPTDWNRSQALIHPRCTQPEDHTVPHPVSRRPAGSLVGLLAALSFALASLARTIGWNVIALPAYILLLVTGVGTVGLFLGLNAYLLGRDMADMVEPRHPALPPLSRSSQIGRAHV